MKSAILGAILVGLSFTAQAVEVELCMAMYDAATSTQKAYQEGIPKQEVVQVVYDTTEGTKSRGIMLNMVDYIYNGGTAIKFFDVCLKAY